MLEGRVTGSWARDACCMVVFRCDRLAQCVTRAEPTAHAGEHAMVRKARALRAAGLSLRAVGRQLAIEGLSPRCGGTWHVKTVRDLVARSILAGHIV